MIDRRMEKSWFLTLLGLFAVVQIFAIIEIANWPISYCLLPGVLCLIFTGIFFSRTTHTIPLTAFGMLLILFFLWLGIVGFWSRMPETHYYFFGYLLAWPIAYWSYVLEPRLNTYWKYLFGLLIIIALISAMLAIYQYVILHHIPLSWFKDKNSQAALSNLFAFPLLGYLIILSLHKPIKILPVILLSVGVIILFTAMSITGSRGATLAAIFATLFLLSTLRKNISFKIVVGLAVIILLPILYGIFFGIYAHTSHNFSSLLHPLTAGDNRLLLWYPAWLLVKEHFIGGIGLGNFYWYLPALRSPLDHSAGLYVHNDYLQILLEAGVLGFTLLCAIIVNIAMWVGKFLKKHPAADARRIEVVSLSAGIFTIFFHSIFNFDLYLLPLLLPLGLLLGRLSYLLQAAGMIRQVTFNACEYTRKSFYYGLGVIIAVAVAIYYFSAAATLWLDIKSDQYLAQNNFTAAKRYLDYANFLQPNRMEPLVSEINYYNKLDKLIPANQIIVKATFYSYIKYYFEQLTKHHPLYAYNYILQAEYYTRNPEFLGKNAQCKIKGFYIHALALAPLSPISQEGYQNFLKNHGDETENC